VKILYFDAFSGAAGDMIVGALLDAGLPIDELTPVVSSLGLEGITIAADRVERCGVAATKFRVHDGRVSARAHPRDGEQQRHDHEHEHHDHEHHGQHHDHHEHHGHDDQSKGREEHHHRGLAEIERLVDGSALSVSARAKAKLLFRTLAETEAAIHQVPVERVHLHEVGASDSIVDIVSAVFGFEWFKADAVFASPLNVGGGTVECEHGTFPVPAPATASLIRGVPVYSSGVEAELLTPTGALLLTGVAGSFGPMPSMTVERIGYGAGDRDLAAMPNVLRVFVGRDSRDVQAEPVVVIECEIDDMNPQIYGVLMDRLHAEGALDVFYAPVQMKKNRPGTLVTVLASPDRRVALRDVIFRETTTLGIRYRDVVREKLGRELVTVETPLGSIRFKVARQGTEVVNASPEFDDCARIAAARGVSVKEVQAIATKAYLDAYPRSR
jgi:uncharacterized protein (TIGR00299 family) protein